MLQPAREQIQATTCRISAKLGCFPLAPGLLRIWVSEMTVRWSIRDILLCSDARHFRLVWELPLCLCSFRCSESFMPEIVNFRFPFKTIIFRRHMSPCRLIGLAKGATRYRQSTYQLRLCPCAFSPELDRLCTFATELRISRTLTQKILVSAIVKGGGVWAKYSSRLSSLSRKGALRRWSGCLLIAAIGMGSEFSICSKRSL